MFCKASTELAKENTVLVSEILIVYFFFVSNDRNKKLTMEFDKKKNLVLTSDQIKFLNKKILLLQCFRE